MSCSFPFLLRRWFRRSAAKRVEVAEVALDLPDQRLNVRDAPLLFHAGIVRCVAHAGLTARSRGSAVPRMGRSIGALQQPHDAQTPARPSRAEPCGRSNRGRRLRALRAASRRGRAWLTRRSSSSRPTRRSRRPSPVARDEPTRLSSGPPPIAWATYGFDDRRARFTPNVTPPSTVPPRLDVPGQGALEFPPAVAYGRISLPTFDGRFYALDARTGKTIWSHRTGRCGWASPAVWDSRVYVTFIGRRATCGDSVPGRDGIVVAYDADNGKVVWQRTTGPNESSPLVAGRTRLRRRLGRQSVGARRADRPHALAFRHDGAVKGRSRSPAARVFIGNYDGQLYALDARTGGSVAVPPRASSGRTRRVLLLTGGRLRSRLHRQHRRQGLRVRRHDRATALVAARPVGMSTPRRPSGAG